MVRIIIIALSLCTTSCSVIKVYTNEEVDVYRKFGFINVVDISNAGAYVDLNFLGVGVSDNDFMLGYKISKKVILSGDSCTIFIDQTSVVDGAILDYLKSINCNFIYLQEELSDE